MTDRKDLYDLAFQYKKAGIWKKMWDSDLFAVKLDDGETGYVSIMGKNGEYCSLGLYIGMEGIKSYFYMADHSEDTNVSYLISHELLLQQECLQLALESKDDLHPDELDELREYAKENNIRFSGKNAYPHFIKFRPGFHPWMVQEKKDLEYLRKTIEVTLLLSDAMKEKTPVEMGILGLSFAKSRVSLFDIEDGKLVHKGYAPLPENGEKKYERSVLKDDKPVKAVASLPKKGIYESELVMMLDAVQNSPDEVPYYPMLLLAVENKSNYLLPVSFMDRWNGDPEDEFVQKLLSAFSESLVQNGSCPGEIRCRDERTYSILSDFCDKAGIKISIYEKR